MTKEKRFLFGTQQCIIGRQPMRTDEEQAAVSQQILVMIGGDKTAGIATHDCAVYYLSL